MKKFSKLAVILAGLTIGAAAQAETLLGFTVYRIARKTSPFRARMNSATAKPF